MDYDAALREQLIKLLEGSEAHATFDKAVYRFPRDKAGLRPRGAPHSAWELLEHMRIAQHDILRFSTSADYVSPKWPEGYWPAGPAPKNDRQWSATVKAFREDLDAMQALVRDPANDLHKPFPWGEGQTLLREALLVADHNSHHLGQLILVRRLIGAW